LSKAELLEEVKVSQIQHCSFLAADNCTQNPEKRHFSISFSSFSPQKFFDHLLALKLFLDFQANRKQNKLKAQAEEFSLEVYYWFEIQQNKKQFFKFFTSKNYQRIITVKKNHLCFSKVKKKLKKKFSMDIW
jgi:hypothetical protein